MAKYSFKYEDLKKQYNTFQAPVSRIYIGGVDVSANKYGFGISDIVVENTCGFEASIASFLIMNTFDRVASVFRFSEVKKFIALGSTVVIYLGYSGVVREVFRGFISSVDFKYVQRETPGIVVNCMDIKGLMMSGTYVKQLTSMCYSDAVSEILKKTNYVKLQSPNASQKGGGGVGAGESDHSHVVTSLKIDNTPDKEEAGASGSGGGKGGGDQKKSPTDKSIEMTAESDYEFVVKAAKKFNYEFFSLGGVVYFRKAKSVEECIMEIGPENGMIDLEVNYDITGLASKVEVRDIDAGKGEVISASLSLNNKISNGNVAKGLISGIERVVIDPTVRSKNDAENRAKYLMEDISYRLGTLDSTMLGVPELSPGRFVVLNALGTDYKVKFYIYTVIHTVTSENGYETRIIGKGASVDAVK